MYLYLDFDDTRTSLSARKKVRVDNVVYRLSQTVDRPDLSIGGQPTAQDTLSAASSSLQATPTAVPRDIVLERAPLTVPGNVSTRSSIGGSSNSRVFRLVRPSVGSGSTNDKNAQQLNQQKQKQQQQGQGQQQQDVDMLPPEITSMLDTYLDDSSSIGNPSQQLQQQRHLPSGHARKLHQDAQQQQQNTTGPVTQPDSEAEDYVYDIYYRYQLPTFSGIPGAPQASGEGLIGLM